MYWLTGRKTPSYLPFQEGLGAGSVLAVKDFSSTLHVTHTGFGVTVNGHCFAC